MGTTPKWETVRDPQPGDLATHVDGHLDSREVTKVTEEGIWIHLFTQDTGPLPVENYTFERVVP